MKNKLKAVGLSLIAIVILIGSQLLAEFLASFVGMLGASNAECYVISAFLYLGFAVLFIWLFYEKLLHIKMADLGITKTGVKAKWVITAFLLPVAVTVAYLLFVKGEYVVADSTRIAADIILLGVFYTGMAAGFVEEMVFRGVIYTLLEKAWNKKVAVLTPSLLFGVVHIIGMDFSVGSCILVIVAGTAVGIMFSLIRMESGSILNSGIVHMVWNVLIIGGIFKVGEKPGKIASYVLNTHSFALTGGEFGIESSVIAVAGYIVVSVIAMLMIRKKEK